MTLEEALKEFENTFHKFTCHDWEDGCVHEATHNVKAFIKKVWLSSREQAIEDIEKASTFHSNPAIILGMKQSIKIIKGLNITNLKQDENSQM